MIIAVAVLRVRECIFTGFKNVREYRYIYTEIKWEFVCTGF